MWPRIRGPVYPIFYVYFGRCPVCNFGRSSKSLSSASHLHRPLASLGACCWNSVVGCCPGLPSTCLAFPQVYSAPAGFSQACQASAWLLPQVYQAPAWLRPRFTMHLQAFFQVDQAPAVLFLRFTEHVLHFCWFCFYLSSPYIRDRTAAHDKPLALRQSCDRSIN